MSGAAHQVAEEDLVDAGTLFGRWVVGRLLGAGGAASVYEAVHADLGRRAALKVLHRRHGFSSLMRTRFVREGRAATRVRHPAVVQVFDVGIQDDRLFLVMEFLDGETLAARIARAAPMSPESAVALLLPLVSAVSAVHAAGVVHRDIKPGNVMLVPDAMGEVQPCLLDFGVSRFADAPHDGVSLTGPEGLLGTPAYMSPEQAMGSRILDGQSDQFALAVTLYECLTGRRPFAGGTWQQTLLMLSNCKPVPVRQVQRGIPGPLDAVVLRAMAREPAMRFPDVRAFGDALVPFAARVDRDRWALRMGDVRPVPMIRHVAVPQGRWMLSALGAAVLTAMAVSALTRHPHGQTDRRNAVIGTRVLPRTETVAVETSTVLRGALPDAPREAPVHEPGGHSGVAVVHLLPEHTPPRRVLGRGPNNAVILAH